MKSLNCISLKAPTLQASSVRKTNLQTDVCSCSGCLTRAMLWIKEVEVGKAVDDLMTSQLIRGH